MFVKKQIISGSNRKALLYSRDGLPLTDLMVKDTWIWSCSAQLGSDRVIIGSEDGSIDMIQMNFDAVHALYKDRYAYRENLTEVVVQHLVTDRKVRIKCRDLVQRLSLYKNKLAVQLSDKVCMYESDVDDTQDLHFRLRRERVLANIPCELMVMVSNHLLFCKDSNLDLYTFDGQKLRTWTMESNISYVKVDGGPVGKEGVVIGLSNGNVMKLYIDNPFPQELTKKGNQIVSVDLSLRRDKVAVVDSQKILTVVDIRTQDVLLTANGALSVCFNSEVDDMLCYTGESSIFVISGIGSNKDGSTKDTKDSKGYEPQEQHIAGLAIGFHGQRIYCLYKASIMGLDIPQGSNMLQLLDRGDVDGAYKMACLGATEADWRTLAMRALRANSLTVAKNAFVRLKDSKFLNLIEAMERAAESGGSRLNAANASNGVSTDRRSKQQQQQQQQQLTKGGLDVSWQAEILAYEGHHHEAAKLYARSGYVDEAIRLLVDLRRWNDAKLFSQNSSGPSNGNNVMDQNSLTMQQAKWMQEVNDWKGAAEILLSLGQYMQAARTVVEHREKEKDEDSGWQLVLVEVIRAVPKDQTDVLSYCGEVLSAANEDVLAREAYAKLGDVSKLMALYVKKQMFAEAAQLADEHEGKFDLSIFLPYAEWLVLQDRYEDAIQAFKKAARNDLARKVLEELTFNAVVESRFKDASYFYWLLSREVDAKDVALRKDYEIKADLYYAYSNVHAYVTDPFTTHLPETLFQVSRFIINTLSAIDTIPYGISKASTLYTLARQAMSLGAYKLARQSYDRLGQLQMPLRKQDEIEHDMIVVQAKPVRDDPEILPVCYRCGSTNPLLNPATNKYFRGDSCSNCGHPFIRSFVNFDILPLVEFIPDPNTFTDEEAIELIRSPGMGNGNRNGKNKKDGLNGGIGGGSKREEKKSRDRDAGWKEAKVGESEMMTFDGPQDDNEDGDEFNAPYGGNHGGSSMMDMDDGGDLFTIRLNATLKNQV